MEKFIHMLFGAAVALLFISVIHLVAGVNSYDTCMSITGAPECQRVWVPIYPDSDY